MLPRLSDASLSSPAQSNLLAPDWHNTCVCVCVSIRARFRLPLLVFVTLLTCSLPRLLARHGPVRLGSLARCPLAALSCQAKLTATLTTTNTEISQPQRRLRFPKCGPVANSMKDRLSPSVLQISCDGACCFPSASAFSQLLDLSSLSLKRPGIR